MIFLSVPPTIIGLSPETVTVVVNNFVSLSCEAVGFPPPTLSWLNDKGPIQANTNALIMPGTATSGHHEQDKYWAVFDNWSHFALKLYLVISMPLSTDNKLHNYSRSWMCVCPFVPAGGRTLQIMKAKVSDGGKYICVAMNAAGEAYKHIYLTVFGESTSPLCALYNEHLSLAWH